MVFENADWSIIHLNKIWTQLETVSNIVTLHSNDVVEQFSYTVLRQKESNYNAAVMIKGRRSRKSKPVFNPEMKFHVQ